MTELQTWCTLIQSQYIQHLFSPVTGKHKHESLWHFPPELCYCKCGQPTFTRHCDWHIGASGRYHQALATIVTNNFLFSMSTTRDYHIYKELHAFTIPETGVSLRLDFLSTSCLPNSVPSHHPAPPQLRLASLSSGCKWAHFYLLIKPSINFVKLFCHIF